jgi:hypothetical protein
MSNNRKFAYLAFATIGLLAVAGATASQAATRDHRNTAGKIYASNCRWHPNCASTSNADGGVLVTRTGPRGQVVVPAKVGLPGGAFGGTVTDHRSK